MTALKSPPTTRGQSICSSRVSDAMDTAKDYRYAASVLIENLLKLLLLFFFAMYYKTICYKLYYCITTIEYIMIQFTSHS